MEEKLKETKEQNMPDQNSVPDTVEIEKVLHDEYYKRDYINAVRNTLYVLIIIAAIALLIATLVLPVIRVYGLSMTPTIGEDSIVICKKTNNPKRGDVLAFYYNNKIIIRRVIGLPGDKVEISSNGVVSINGAVLEEDYLNQTGDAGDLEYPYHVPAGYYFVLADNRTDSIDSRSSLFGNIQEEDFIGKVILCVWPFNHLGLIKK